MEIPTSNRLANLAIRIFFAAMLNLLLMSITGYLTLDVHANGNSRIGAVLLSFFLPMFLVSRTMTMSPLQRLLRFGSGYAVYIVLALIIIGLPMTMVTWLGPCLLLSLVTLYYGGYLFPKSTTSPDSFHSIG
jgi:hypothetical protein